MFHAARRPLTASASDVGTLQRCCTKSELGAVATSQTIKQREAFILVHNQSDAFRLSPGLVATAPSSDFVWRTLTLFLGNIARGESDIWMEV